MNKVYLSFGSNINPEENIQRAIKMLTTMAEVMAVSSIWETKPVGLVDQANFLNGAVLVRTPLAASQVKGEIIRAIEEQLQRVRQTDKNAPRTIDLDIVLFNQQILEVAGSRIPDPEIYKRPFLALPLAEIDSDYKHPESGDTLQQIADRFTIEASEMILRAELSQAVSRIFKEEEDHEAING